MKQITNFQLATVFDIEADALLDNATKLHVLSFNMSGNKSGSIEGSNHDRIRAFFKWHIDYKVPVVAHNGICYDIPLVEKLLDIDLSELMVIDTMALSWYLNVERQRHGLDSFLEDYGIEKPKIENWENLTYEEYLHRCQEDVKINKALWDDLRGRLFDIYTRVKLMVDDGYADGSRASDDEVRYLDQYKNTEVTGYIDRILTFLMYKMDCLRLQEITRVKLDIPKAKELEETLTTLTDKAMLELEAVMPKVPRYAPRKRPAKPFKKNGEPSASGLEWKENEAKVGKKDEYGNWLAEYTEDHNLKVLVGYDEPNINSSDQLKEWFFSLGWKPKTFKWVKDKEAQDLWAAGGFKGKKPVDRAIPQISKEGENGKELCDSVLELAEEVPQIKAYAGYTLLKHRLGIVKGFLENVSEDGYLKARIGGFTNTLRVQHREIVNLPGVGKPWGKEIRGLLISGKGQIFQGSDLASLEDRVKHDFMTPLDPDYVSKMMADDYDPHLTTALSAGMITQQEFDDYMSGIKTDKVKAARKIGKQTNYALN